MSGRRALHANRSRDVLSRGFMAGATPSHKTPEEPQPACESLVESMEIERIMECRWRALCFKLGEHGRGARAPYVQLIWQKSRNRRPTFEIEFLDPSRGNRATYATVGGA